MIPNMTDYRVTATRYVALVAVTIVSPFVVNHFLQGRVGLGVLCSIIVATLCASGYKAYKGKPICNLLFVGFVPTVVLLLAISLLKQGVTAVFWVFPTIMTFYLMLSEKRAWMANLLILVVMSAMSFQYLDLAIAPRVTASLLSVSLFSAILTRVISDQQIRLHRQIVTDSLTGLTDRVLLASTLQSAAEHCRDTRSIAALVAVDIDHFKSINDTYGHDVGDEVLRQVGAVLRNNVRKGDVVFRLGGEEFLVLLYDMATKENRAVAEKLRTAISEVSVIPDRKISASFGIANYRQSEEWKVWMKRADKKLYEAKNRGRNKVICDVSDVENSSEACVN